MLKFFYLIFWCVCGFWRQMPVYTLLMLSAAIRIFQNFPVKYAPKMEAKNWNNLDDLFSEDIICKNKIRMLRNLKKILQRSHSLYKKKLALDSTRRIMYFGALSDCKGKYMMTLMFFSKV